MSDQPWADPGLSLDERLCHVLERTVIVDARGKSVSGAVAILRETFKAIRADALEEVALLITADIPDDPLRQDMEDRDDLGLAELIRSMKADATTA